MSNRRQKSDGFAENGQVEGQEENKDNSSDDIMLIPTCSFSSRRRSHYTAFSDSIQGSQPKKKNRTEKDKDEHIKELYVENENLRVKIENLQNKLLINEMKQELQSKNDVIKNLQQENQKFLSEINNPQKENQKLLSEIKNPVTSIKRIRDIPVDGKVIHDILFFSSQNEKMVAASVEDNGNDGVIKIIRLRDNKLIKTINSCKDEDGFYALGMTTIDGVDVIASGEYDGKKVTFWNINNFEEVGFFNCSDPVCYLESYNKNGKQMLACGLEYGSIELWDVQSKKRVHTLEDHEKDIRALHAFEYDKKLYLLSSSDDEKLNLWCLDDENKLVKMLSNEKKICSLTTVKFGGDLLVFANGDRKIMSWRMSNLEVYHEFNFENGSLFYMKLFMSNGKIFLATVSNDGWFRVLDIELKKVVHEVKCEDHKFYFLNLYEEDGSVVFVTFENKEENLVFFKSHNMQAL